MGIQLVIFDGLCGLCHSFVRMMLKIDRNKVLHFAPCQGQTAASHGVTPRDISNPTSIIFIDRHGKIHRESDAILLAFIALNGVYRIFAIFLVLPPSIRNGIYRFIAKRRYQMFGKYETCPMPNHEDRGRFLP